MSKRKPVELYRCNDRYWFPAWLARSRSERLVSADLAGPLRPASQCPLSDQADTRFKVGDDQLGRIRRTTSSDGIFQADLFKLKPGEQLADLGAVVD